jgi:hypothetical protein
MKQTSAHADDAIVTNLNATKCLQSMIGSRDLPASSIASFNRTTCHR